MVAVDSDKIKPIRIVASAGVTGRVREKIGDVMFRVRSVWVQLRRYQRNKRRGIVVVPGEQAITPERREFQRRSCCDRRAAIRWDGLEQARRKDDGRRQDDKIWRINAKMRSMLQVEEIRYLD